MIIEFQFGEEHHRMVVPPGQELDYLRLLKGREDSGFIGLPAKERGCVFLLPKNATAFRVSGVEMPPKGDDDSSFWNIVNQ